jgi:hypothetical protein
MLFQFLALRDFILAAGDVHLFNFNGLTKKNICTLYADSFGVIEQQLMPILAEHMSVLDRARRVHLFWIRDPDPVY